MKTNELPPIPEGKRAEWINGVLTLVDDKPIEYKFKVGDKVIFPLFSKDKAMTITEQLAVNGCPCYNLKSYNNIYIRGEEDEIQPYVPQDITERIKTFEDAYQWCVENGEANLVNHYDDWEIYNDTSKDIIAYLRLRIITAALNEGWEPTPGEEETRYYPYLEVGTEAFDVNFEITSTTVPAMLCFKSESLAAYAVTQFRDVYVDFYGCQKGGEE